MSQEDDTKPRSATEFKARKIPPDKVKEELRKASSMAWIEPSPEQKAEWEATAQAAEKQLINGIGDIVQITVEEVINALSEATQEQIGNGSFATVSSAQVHQVLGSARKRIPVVTERVMNRLKQGEEPYSSRQKSEESS